MIDIDNWMRELEEEEDIEIKNNEEYQTKLFEEYVLRGSDHQEERRKLNERYLSGEELMGEHGLRKELAAFDMSYFGRAYLPHYFIRKSPHFHEELDEIWSRGVMKGRNPLKEAKVISRLKGSRQVVAAPRGHAKSTNFTFKDSLHAILYAYKHYILILSDSSEQAEGFLDDIKTELEDNANIIMDFGSLKGDKAWRTGVILTKTDIKAEAIGSGKKVRGRRHRNWRPDLIVLDDIENDENVNTPEQRRKLKNWFDKAVSKAGDTYTDIMYIDGHVRESHAVMEGRVYRADDPIWDVWYPPNGFRCRCMVVSLSKKQVERMGLHVETEAPYDVDYSTGEILTKFPDKGFSNNPAKTVWKPDMTNISPELRKMFRERKQPEDGETK